MNTIVQQYLDKATQIYYGINRACRCGCKGTYADKGTKAFTARVNRILKMGTSIVYQADSNNLNILLPNGKAYTVYID